MQHNNATLQELPSFIKRRKLISEEIVSQPLFIFIQYMYI